MSITPLNFFETAKSLAAGSSEADSRSAISRAYYAALHSSEEALPNSFRSTDRKHDASSHQTIIDDMVRFGSSLCPGRTEARQVAGLLPKLKQYRKKADYELSENVSDSDKNLSMTMAERILNLTEIIREKSNKPTV